MVARRPLAILASVCVVLQLAAWAAVVLHHGDRTRPHRVGDSARRRAACSPDGSKLTSDNAGQLYVVGEDGTGLRQINVGGIAVGSEAWSPDGRQIALVSQPDPYQHVTLVNADGSGAPIDVGKLA